MRAIVNFILLATLFVLASPTNAQISVPAKTIENALVRAMQVAKRTALKDATGKVTQLDVEVMSRRQTVQFNYEGQTLDAITFDNGVKATILRNKSGSLKGFSFPHGSQLIFLQKKVPGLDYQLPDGFKFITPNGKEIIYPLFSAISQKNRPDGFAKVSFSLDPESDCQYATALAAAAASNAAIICATGEPINCAGATATALIVAANAVRICSRIVRDGDFGGGGSGGGWDCPGGGSSYGGGICPAIPTDQW